MIAERAFGETVRVVTALAALALTGVAFTTDTDPVQFGLDSGQRGFALGLVVFGFKRLWHTIHRFPVSSLTRTSLTRRLSRTLW